MDKKKILKRIKGLEKQKQKHKDKIESYEGKKDHLKPYWEKEIARMDAEISEERRRLKKEEQL